MRKQLTEKAVYQPRHGVKVTVDNKPVYDEDTKQTTYIRKVTLVVDAGEDFNKMSFSDSDDMAQFFGNVDFEEPQTSLDLEN